MALKEPKRFFPASRRGGGRIEFREGFLKEILLLPRQIPVSLIGMKPLTAILPYRPGLSFKKTLRSMANSPLVESVVWFARNPFL